MVKHMRPEDCVVMAPLSFNCRSGAENMIDQAFLDPERWRIREDAEVEGWWVLEPMR